jgi:predicted TIM-barrel fold metal-dependent hydrolase
MRIVDAHHHLWDLQGPVGYPWLMHEEPTMLGDYSKIRRDYLPEEYLRDTALHDVVATVHVEADAHSDTPWVETEWLHRMQARHGLPNAIVAHAWIDRPESEEVLSRQSAFPLVRGIRTKPVTASKPGDSVRGQKRSMQDEVWLRGLSRLEHHSLSWDMRVPWWHLEEAAEVARTFPSLRIALNHTGYPWDRSPEALAGWRRGMAALADCPNVWCKISGLSVPGQPWLLSANGPIIRDVIAMFGASRCMFASNFPVESLKASWDYLYRCYQAAVSDLDPRDQARLFADNAVKFYRIDCFLPAENRSRSTP